MCSYTEFYLVSLGFNWVLFVFVQRQCVVLPSFTWYYWVYWVLARFYLVLYTDTGFYWLFSGF